MTDRIVIYHGPGCADGFTAAWVAWTVYHDKAEYVEAQYGDAPPDVAGKDVLIVDFSYPRAALLEMAEKARSIQVFDHHKSAAADLAGLDFCVFDMHRSGAAIAWDMLRQGERRPNLVELVQDRDLWRWKIGASKELNAWIGAQERTFPHWDYMRLALEDEAETVMRQRYRISEEGRQIIKHIDAYVASTAKNAILVRFCGFSVPFVNAPGMMASELIGKLAESAPFAVGWFQRADGRYQYSLRSRGTVDVSVIAERFGGGGHKQAAGFESMVPPDRLTEPVPIYAEPDAIGAVPGEQEARS
jgi:oligoribonuclease NrnB/cAMP/cGMP phosphodiesterase (DHH superfamily)